MLKGILRKIKSDKASSSIISFLLLVPLLLGVVITAVDMSFYFSNRSQVEAIAGDAARTIGIFGGNGDKDRATTIENRYGTSLISQPCSPAGRTDIQSAPNKYIFDKGVKTTSYDFKDGKGTIPVNSTPVECNVLAALANSTGLTSFSQGETDVIAVSCGPRFAESIGERTYCKVAYTYSGMPGAPLSFIQARQDDGSSAGLLSKNIVTKSSESEVKLTDNDLTARR